MTNYLNSAGVFLLLGGLLISMNTCSSDPDIVEMMDNGPREIECDQDFGDPAKSQFILPYPVGKTYELEQGYCPPNPNWGHHNWFAYDFKMPIGDTLIASASGTVIAVRDNNPDVSDCSGGKENFVFIRHGTGTVMSYVHLTPNSVQVKAGDRVIQGQFIGLSGNSGCSLSPHTHIALFKDNTNYDRQSTIPLNYKNLQGPLDGNRGLIQKETYKALPF